MEISKQELECAAQLLPRGNHRDLTSAFMHFLVETKLLNFWIKSEFIG